MNQKVWISIVAVIMLAQGTGMVLLGLKLKNTLHQLAQVQAELATATTKLEQMNTLSESLQTYEQNSTNSYQVHEQLQKEFNALRCITQFDKKYTSTSLAYGWATKSLTNSWVATCEPDNYTKMNNDESATADAVFSCSLTTCPQTIHANTDPNCKAANAELSKNITTTALVTPIRLSVLTGSRDEHQAFLQDPNVNTSPLPYSASSSATQNGTNVKITFYSQSPDVLIPVGNREPYEPYYRKYILSFQTYEPKTIAELRPFISQLLTKFTLLPNTNNCVQEVSYF